jgi:hypothetical protein
MTIGNGPGRRAMIEQLEYEERMEQDTIQLRAIVREQRVSPTVPTSILSGEASAAAQCARSEELAMVERQTEARRAWKELMEFLGSRSYLTPEMRAAHIAEYEARWGRRG